MKQKHVFILSIIFFLSFPFFQAYGAPALPDSPEAPDFFYRMTQAGGKVWVAPPVWKVMQDTQVPTATSSTINLWAAGNEYEPIQIVARPGASGTATLSIGSSWSGAANTISAELHQVRYVPISNIHPSDQYGYAGQWPDPLYPISFGAGVSVSAGQNQPFWLTVHVPSGTSSGAYSNTVTITVDGSSYTIPIQVTVFDFELPGESSFDSYANFSFSSLGGSDLNRMNEIKMWWHRHRINPLGVTWPSGFKWSIVWENASKAPMYAPPVDEYDTESNANYRVRELADKYIMGNGFNDDVGFSSFEAIRFVDNNTPRPSSFAGISRGSTHYGTSAYNDAWGAYLAALQNYFDPAVPYTPPTSYGNPYGHDYLSKARYYVMNEPQDDEDFKLAAYLAKITKQYAPKLKIMISEEAKPEIYNNADYPGYGYDIWLPNIPQFASAVTPSWERLRDHGEISWFYSLGHDSVPFINPIMINHPGLEPRLITWLAWKYRVEGYAYYSWNNFSSNMWNDPDFMSSGRNGEGFLMYAEPGTTSCTDKFIPSIRLELLRESFEDYEYFRLANSGQKPTPFVTNSVDAAIDAILPAMTGYNPDPAKMLWVRREIGKYLSGSASLPTAVGPSPATRPYGEYHINFQDPSGSPTANPLVIDGKTWMKVGWDAYDPDNQIGWLSDDMGYSDRLIVKYDEWEDGNDLQKSILYNNYGGRDTFLFGIANGVYNVEIDCGRRGSLRNNIISVNGVPFVGDHDSGTLEQVINHVQRTKTVKVTSGMLVLEIGCRSCLNDSSEKKWDTNEWAFISYISITPTISLEQVISILRVMTGLSADLTGIEELGDDNVIGLSEAISILQQLADIQ